jgi:hypothetical protein
MFLAQLFNITCLGYRNLKNLEAEGWQSHQQAFNLILRKFTAELNQRFQTDKLPMNGPNILFESKLMQFLLTLSSISLMTLHISKCKSL